MSVHAILILIYAICHHALSSIRACLQSVHVFYVAIYFFIANNTYYASWTLVYLTNMLNLTRDTYTVYKSGKFADKRKPGVFNCLWSDLATAKTIIITDSKASGGIVGTTVL